MSCCTGERAPCHLLRFCRRQGIKTAFEEVVFKILDTPSLLQSSFAAFRVQRLECHTAEHHRSAQPAAERLMLPIAEKHSAVYAIQGSREDAFAGLAQAHSPWGLARWMRRASARPQGLGCRPA